MQTIQENMTEFQRQLRIGTIQKAYRALLEYMIDLRSHFKTRYPDYAISGLYQGTMNMTYFAIVPPTLKRLDLKIAIVFNYDAFRFEAWLSGSNRQVQRKHWELFSENQWTKNRLATPGKGVDSIIECDLAEEFDFSDLDSLTVEIETKTDKFINDVKDFLLDHETV